MSLVARRTWFDHLKLWVARGQGGLDTRRFNAAIENATAVQDELFDQLVRRGPRGDFQATTASIESDPRGLRGGPAHPALCRHRAVHRAACGRATWGPF
jgi:hypothetical protein